MAVDFGTYDPGAFAQPGDNDLTVDLSHLVLTEIVCLNTDTEMACMAYFSHGLGFWRGCDGQRHETAIPVRGVICWSGDVDEADPDTYIDTYVGTLEWWANQIESLRLTAAIGKSALLVAHDAWVGLPASLTIDIE